MAFSLRQLEKLNRDPGAWFPAVRAWLCRLRLWPGRSIAAWCAIAAGGWLALLPLVYAVAAASVGPGGAPDNYRYFHSAVAQSIAALGALVLVASFTIAQGTARAARVTIIYDVAFQRAVGAVLACVLIPLAILTIIPPAGSRLTWQKAASGATYLLLVGALAVVVQYALSVPQHLAQPRLRRRLLQLLDEALEHGAPAAASLSACALDQCREDILGSLSPAAHGDLPDAVRDLRALTLTMADNDLSRQAVLDTWRVVAVGTIAETGERGSDIYAPSRDIVTALWGIAGDQLGTPGRQALVASLHDLIVKSAYLRLEAGDKHWADRFWGTLKQWVRLHLTDDEQGRHVLVNVLPNLVHSAFWLLLEEVRQDSWEQVVKRIDGIWGKNSDVQRRFSRALTEHLGMLRSQDEAKASRRDLAIQVYAEPLAAILVLGGVALKKHPESVRALANTTKDFAEATYVLESISHDDLYSPVHKYAMETVLGKHEEDYSEIGGTSAGTVPQDYHEFAVLVRCALEDTKKTEPPFAELRWTRATQKWYELLENPGPTALAEQFAATGVFSESASPSQRRRPRCSAVSRHHHDPARDRALELLKAMHARLEQLMRENARPRPGVTSPGGPHSTE